jgi:hypothetical protein
VWRCFPSDFWTSDFGLSSVARNGAESSIKSQWPGGTSVTRRASSKVHTTTRGKIFPGFRFHATNRRAEFWRSRAANSLAAARKFFGDGFDLFREPAPVEAVNGFGGNDFAQRLNPKRGLRAGAAVIVAAQADWVFPSARGSGTRRARA